MHFNKWHDIFIFEFASQGFSVNSTTRLWESELRVDREPLASEDVKYYSKHLSYNLNSSTFQIHTSTGDGLWFDYFIEILFIWFESKSKILMFNVDPGIKDKYVHHSAKWKDYVMIDDK